MAASRGNIASMESCAEGGGETVQPKVGRKFGRLVARTISERYWEMRMTEGQRVALGALLRSGLLAPYLPTVRRKCSESS